MDSEAKVTECSDREMIVNAKGNMGTGCHNVLIAWVWVANSVVNSVSK